MSATIPKIFISSTTIDLPEYRKAAVHACQRVGLMPLYMEEWPPDPRAAVNFCMAKLDEANLYLGILAHRYGYIPDGYDISITEIEYRRALERGIPIYVFMIDPDYPWLPSQIDRGNSYNQLEAFKSQVAKTHTFQKFRDPQSFKEDLLLFLPSLVPKPLQGSGGRPHRSAVPVPPEMHSVPPYILTTSFVGRDEELAELDKWGCSTDPIMVLDAIGGVGKSALAWEWTQKRARRAVPDLSGILWWSFYETGATMSSMAAEALAYITGTAPTETRKITPIERTRMLLIELRRRPYLLVLDGFERVLTAYHRLDPSKLRDEQVQNDLRACTNLRDSFLLRELVTCAPSKILVSTRLMPKALENAAHQPIPGVRRKNLSGLASEDGVELLRCLGIRGNQGTMRRVLEQFDNHGLLITILAGRILDYRPASGNFDLWLNDPKEGGGLRLSHLDLKQRRTHILEYAFQGLEPKVKGLVSRLAAFSDAVDYKTLSILNPYIEHPQEVKKPIPFEETVQFKYSIGNTERIQAPAERSEINEKLSRARAEYQRIFDRQKAAYNKYKEYFSSPEYRNGISAFDAALVDLENRGLLQWDRQLDSYDLHPVVRAYAFDQLEQSDRLQTYDRIRDHFERLPPEHPNEATDLAQLKNTIQIYRAFVGAEHGERAGNLYIRSLSFPLLFSIASYTTVIELLLPLFTKDLDQLPLIPSAEDQAYISGDLSMAFSLSGQHEKAVKLKRNAIRLSFELRSLRELATHIRNYSVDLRATNRLASAVRALELARDLSDAFRDPAGRRMAHFHLAATYTVLGQPKRVRQEIAAFREGEALSKRMYRPGGAERHACWSKFFEGTLSIEETNEALTKATRENSREVERSMYHLQAELYLKEGDASKAIELAEQALAMASKAGTPMSEYQGCLARAQVEQGLKEAAQVMIQEALEPDHEGVLNRPYCDAAEVYLALGHLDNAKKYALLAYRQAWADGPPYVWQWHLERSRKVLKALNTPEPQLPHFDVSRIEAVPNENDILKLLERAKETLDKKAPRVATTTGNKKIGKGNSWLSWLFKDTDKKL